MREQLREMLRNPTVVNHEEFRLLIVEKGIMTAKQLLNAEESITRISAKKD